MSCLSSESFASSSSGISSASSLHSSHHSTETTNSNTKSHISCGEQSTITTNSISSSTKSTLQINECTDSDDDRQTPKQQQQLIDTNILEIQPHRLVIGVCPDNDQKLEKGTPTTLEHQISNKLSEEILEKKDSKIKGNYSVYSLIILIKFR